MKIESSRQTRTILSLLELPLLLKFDFTISLFLKERKVKDETFDIWGKLEAKFDIENKLSVEGSFDIRKNEIEKLENETSNIKVV